MAEKIVDLHPEQQQKRASLHKENQLKDWGPARGIWLYMMFTTVGSCGRFEKQIHSADSFEILCIFQTLKKIKRSLKQLTSYVGRVEQLNIKQISFSKKK